MVLVAVGARRVGGDRGRRGDGRGVLGADEEPLAQRRDRRGDDPLGEALVVDERDVEDPEAGLAAGGIEILAAGLDRDRISGWQMQLADVRPGCSWACSSLPALRRRACGNVGIGQLVQRAADDRLRLVALGDHHGRPGRARPPPPSSSGR